MNNYIKIPYASALDVLALFDPDEEVIELAQSHDAIIDFIEQMRENESYIELTMFFAHALPLREAIWWGYQCLSSRDDWDHDEHHAILSAKLWVESPDEHYRRHAELMIKNVGLDAAPGWIAQAVFWSGGSITPKGEPSTEPPLYLYAKAVAGAVNLCAILPDGENKAARFDYYYKMALNIARGGNGIAESIKT
ncbi:Twin-arginine translocation pathway signal [uncultured Shewanella sp.]|uniref:DUF6931 family protein n=1 Tax=uncultured Shewanella sp. TaxID=173975 RepID=UPI0026352763|nr:Twin-arginine translocation pathway signal [uncultured Shewanella sp.]